MKRMPKIVSLVFTIFSGTLTLIIQGVSSPLSTESLLLVFQIWPLIIFLYLHLLCAHDQVNYWHHSHFIAFSRSRLYLLHREIISIVVNPFFSMMMISFGVFYAFLIRNYFNNIFIYLILYILGSSYILVVFLIIKNSSTIESFSKHTGIAFSIYIILYNLPLISKKYCISSFSPFNSLFISPLLLQGTMRLVSILLIFIYMFLLIVILLRIFRKWPISQ